MVNAKGRAKYGGLHTLRHFYASWCINRRVDGGLELPLKMVSTRLGHASIQITADRYGHLFPSTDDGAELAAAEKAENASGSGASGDPAEAAAKPNRHNLWNGMDGTRADVSRASFRGLAPRR